jgi:uncharacterized SAM-binding protein YcdF (DUF218 family)
VKNKGLGTLVVLMAILLFFGAGSAGLLPPLPILTQTTDPNANPTMVTPEQANQFVFFVIFVLVNLIGAGGTIALLLWFLGRATSHARSQENQPNPLLNNIYQRLNTESTLPQGDTKNSLPDSTTSN